MYEVFGSRKRVFATLIKQTVMKHLMLLVLAAFFNGSLTLSIPTLPNFLQQQRIFRLDPHNQAPIMPFPNPFAKIPLLGSSDKGDDASPPASGDLMISDVIGKERSINIFAGFTRDTDTIAARFDDTGKNSTVLAPLNSAIQKLPRKPWEDPEDYNALGEDAYSGKGGEDRANRNLRRFVEAHVVPSSPWTEGKKMTTVGGSTVWWEQKDGKRIVCSLGSGSSDRVHEANNESRFNLARSRSRVSILVLPMGRFGSLKEF